MTLNAASRYSNSACLSTKCCTLPSAVRGRSFTPMNSRGTLKRASCASTWSNTPSWITDLGEATSKDYVHGANCHAWQVSEAYDQAPAHTYGNYYYKAIDSPYQACNVPRPILCCK